MRELGERVLAAAGREGETLRFVTMAHSDREPEREIQRRVPDVSKARRVLSWESNVGLEDGLKMVMASGAIQPSWSPRG